MLQTRRIAGQVRITDKSSNANGMFIQEGIGAGTLKGVVPAPKMNKRLNPKLESSHRGKDDLKGKIDPRGSDHMKGSTFVEPRSFQSVGFMRTTNANIESNNNRMEVPDRTKPAKVPKGHGSNVPKKPAREGKKDESGQSLPTKVGSKAPTKTSDVMKPKKNLGKKLRKAPKKMTLKKAGKPRRATINRAKKEMKNKAHNSEHM